MKTRSFLKSVKSWAGWKNCIGKNQLSLDFDNNMFLVVGLKTMENLQWQKIPKWKNVLEKRAPAVFASNKNID